MALIAEVRRDLASDGDTMMVLNPRLVVVATIEAMHAAEGDELLEAVTLAMVLGHDAATVAANLDMLGVEEDEPTSVRLLKAFTKIKKAKVWAHDQSTAWLAALRKEGIIR